MGPWLRIEDSDLISFRILPKALVHVFCELRIYVRFPRMASIRVQRNILVLVAFLLHSHANSFFIFNFLSVFPNRTRELVRFFNSYIFKETYEYQIVVAYLVGIVQFPH